MSLLKNFFQKIKENHIDEYTAGCAYYTLLAFIPFLMLILTLTKYVGIEEETLFFVLKEIIPSNILNDAILNIVKEVYSKSLGTITLSALLVLWSAGKGFFALCKGLNKIYQGKDTGRTLKFRIKATINTAFFIFAIVFSLLLLIFGNNIYDTLQQRYSILQTIAPIIRGLINMILLSGILMLMYRLIPQQDYSLKNHIPGAIVASVACNLISIFYSLYIKIFKGFSIMYGSLTTIVLAMMWLYACIYSILVGAIINKEILENKKEKS